MWALHLTSISILSIALVSGLNPDNGLHPDQDQLSSYQPTDAFIGKFPDPTFRADNQNDCTENLLQSSRLKPRQALCKPKDPNRPVKHRPTNPSPPTKQIDIFGVPISIPVWRPSNPGRPGLSCPEGYTAVCGPRFPSWKTTELMEELEYAFYCRGFPFPLTAAFLEPSTDGPMRIKIIRTLAARTADIRLCGAVKSG